MTQVARVFSFYYNERRHTWVASETCLDGTTINSYFKTQSEAKRFAFDSGPWMDEPCPGNLARQRMAERMWWNK